MQIASRSSCSTTQHHNFKRFEFPDGFKMLIDTREQRPFFMRLADKYPDHFIIDTVTNGDYTLQGFKTSFAVERKQLSDFYSYISSERSVQHKNDKKRMDRTKGKLIKLSKFEFAGLVIEADYFDIFNRQVFTNVSPEVARQFLVSVNIRYGIHVFINGRRKECERWLLDRAIKYYNLKRGLI